MTGEQLRAARAMLRIDQRQLADLAHVTLSTIRRLERTRGAVVGAPALLNAIQAALETAGVEFIESGPYSGPGGPGIRLKGEIYLEDEVVNFEPDPSDMRERSIA